MRETSNLDINQNRNNPGLSQLDGTEERDGQSGLRLFCPAVQEEWKTAPPPGREDPESFSKTIEKIFHVSFLVNITLPFHLSSSLLNYYFKVKLVLKEGETKPSTSPDVPAVPSSLFI